MKEFFKKQYNKPELEIVNVDREISLIMMTSETDPGGGDPRSAPSNTEKSSPTETNSFKENPFNEK